jgi:glutathione peroxidase
MPSLYRIAIKKLGGSDLDLAAREGHPTLVVNVASQCGLTPQYAGLQRLHERFADQGFSVLGVPCNQFGGQEPGTADEIATFCETGFGVTFPMTEKVEVNGTGRHPLYQLLTQTTDESGTAGDVQWNFEKFLVGPDGSVLRRFRPRTDPESPQIVEAVRELLTQQGAEAALS